jgi:nanoRNase/pAp phosphatase (c-di-AMP/oligoRNAs hydrolase)
LARKTRSKFPFVEPSGLKKVAVICHRNADADAYLSAFAISKLLHSIAPDSKVDIATPGGMTSLTAKLGELFKATVVEEPIDDYDLYVAVDVGDTELLKGWLTKMRESHGERVLVDHHPLRDRETYDHVVVDDEATSAAEVVFRLYGELGVEIDRETAQALLEGILFDSQHLSIAGSAALHAVVALLDRGADVDEARRALRSQPDYGEVIAKLKGAQRIKIFKLGPWVAATSEVGSFQAQVARSMILLGADVAAVGGTSEGETRVSLRSNQRFFDTTRIKLGSDVAGYLADGLGGHGGGHSTAASFTCPGTKPEAQFACVERLAQMLSLRTQEVK